MANDEGLFNKHKHKTKPTSEDKVKKPEEKYFEKIKKNIYITKGVLISWLLLAVNS